MQNILEKIKNLQSVQKPVQLHLGCGKRFIPEFLHIDLDKFPHIDVVGNVSDLSYIYDNTVDLIYACHVLEYFDNLQKNSFLEYELKNHLNEN